MSKDFTNEDTISAGWGLIGDPHQGYGQPPILLALNQTVTDASKCREAYLTVLVDVNYNDGQICTGGEKRKNTCKGDSGGPLYWKGSFEPDISARTFLLGITSHGPGSCMIEFPSVFTRTNFFMKWIVRLGEWNTTGDPDCQGHLCAPPVQDINIAEVMVHNDYSLSRFSVKNDIALIRLETPAKLNSFVQPVCLPYGAAMRKDFTNEDTISAGWGRLGDPNQGYGRPSILLALNLTVTDASKCRKIYSTKFIDVNYNDGQICAGGDKRKNTCKGDSGGPLYWKGSFEPDISARTFLLGITSHGARSCMIEFPAVFTRINFFMKWILDHMKE
ncbi:hypothetical protein WDU94_015296 [Cyamophila willieti]